MPRDVQVHRISLDIDPRSLPRRMSQWDSPAFLESGPGFGPAGRWSILAARPVSFIEASGHLVRVRDRWTTHVVLANPLDVLGNLLSSRLDPFHPPAVDVHQPPFLGGYIGYLAYDLAPHIEVLPRKAPREGDFPDLWLGLYDTFVAIDLLRDTAEVWAVDLSGEGPHQNRLRADRWARELAGPASFPPVAPPSLGSLRGNLNRDAFLQRVRRALDYIAAGDIFQVNLAQRFMTTGSFEPFELYSSLKRLSPAPFAAYLSHGACSVISSSPELFYQSVSKQITTRPIKGTRPRGTTAESDLRNLQELRSSEKERAELAMIVDLERNDLGKVCQYGSVRVAQAWQIESYAQVHHQVATVQGTLRPDVASIDVVRAMFPGGSITGAPKIRAMQIIDELEPNRRGLYTGSIGYFTLGGDCAFNIAIRTMLAEADRVSFHVGGGIVADSDPAAEYEETLHKARGMIDALEGRP